MNDAKREAHGIGTNLLTLVAQAALPAFHVQLARFLAASGYGVYTWSNAFVDMFSLLTLFGMDQAVARHVALAYADGDEKRGILATATALRVVLLSGILVSGALIFAAPAVASFQSKPELVTPLRVLAFVPIFYHATTIFLVATQARQVMKYNFWVRGVVQPMGLLVLTSVVLRVHATVPAAALAVVVGMGVTTLAAAFAYRRELPLGATLRAAVSGPMDWRLVRLAVPLVSANLLWSLQGRLDTFFLGHYKDTAAIGAYAACVLYVTTISQVRQAFDPVICAMIPPLLAKGDVAGLNAAMRRQTRWSALAAVPLFVLFAGFGDGLLPIFGNEFRQGSTAMVVLAGGHLFNALSLSAWAVSMSGHARFTAVAAGLAVLVQAVLLPTLVPRYGLLGAAIASASGFIVAQGVQMVMAYRLTGVHGLSVGLVKVFAAGGAAWAAGRALFTPEWASLPVRFFASVGLSIAVYLLALPLLGLEAEEGKALRALGDRWFSRPPGDA